jgi:hypothetical protein
VVVGARSALFLPFRDLGLIVVDEEHDLAYKQEERVFYSARDMAVARGHLAQFPVVLSSATPSIESRVNADAGRYRRIVLADRYKAAPLPTIGAIDLREHQPDRGRFLSPPLVAAIGETLADQPPRLRAAHPLPHLRPPLPVPELLDLAGRTPLSRRAALPPLRPFREAAGGLPPLRRYAKPDAGGTRS